MTTISNDNNEYISECFKELDYSAQEISGKEFDSCTFKECDFSETILNRCKFIDCQFINCNLSVAKLQYSKFSDVEFEQCKVIGIDWTKADWPSMMFQSPLKFYKCILNDCSFFGLDMAEIVIEDCKAHDADFREGNFSKANFSYSDLSHSQFNRTNLSEADFSEASNYSIDIYNNKIGGAKFSRHEAISLLESLDIELVD